MHAVSYSVMLLLLAAAFILTPKACPAASVDPTLSGIERVEAVTRAEVKAILEGREEIRKGVAQALELLEDAGIRELLRSANKRLYTASTAHPIFTAMLPEQHARSAWLMAMLALAEAPGSETPALNDFESLRLSKQIAGFFMIPPEQEAELREKTLELIADVKQKRDMLTTTKTFCQLEKDPVHFACIVFEDGERLLVKSDMYGVPKLIEACPPERRCEVTLTVDGNGHLRQVIEARLAE